MNSSPDHEGRFAPSRSPNPDAILRSRRKSALPRMTSAILRISGETPPVRIPSLPGIKLRPRWRRRFSQPQSDGPDAGSLISQASSPARAEDADFRTRQAARGIALRGSASLPLLRSPTPAISPRPWRASPSVSPVRVSHWRLERTRLKGSVSRGKRRASFLLFGCHFILSVTLFSLDRNRKPVLVKRPGWVLHSSETPNLPKWYE